MRYETASNNTVFRSFAKVFADFRELYPTAVVMTSPTFQLIKESDGKERQTVYFRAEILVDGNIIAVGHAGEFAGELGKAKDSETDSSERFDNTRGVRYKKSGSKKVFEKLETSAIRRALVCLGIATEEEDQVYGGGSSSGSSATSSNLDDIFDGF